jgi:hypothetical protein
MRRRHRDELYSTSHSRPNVKFIEVPSHLVADAKAMIKAKTLHSAREAQLGYTLPHGRLATARLLYEGSLSKHTAGEDSAVYKLGHQAKHDTVLANKKPNFSGDPWADGASRRHEVPHSRPPAVVAGDPWQFYRAGSALRPGASNPPAGSSAMSEDVDTAAAFTSSDVAGEAVPTSSGITDASKTIVPSCKMTSMQQSLDRRAVDLDFRAALLDQRASELDRRATVLLASENASRANAALSREGKCEINYHAAAQPQLVTVLPQSMAPAELQNHFVAVEPLKYSVPPDFRAADLGPVVAANRKIGNAELLRANMRLVLEANASLANAAFVTVEPQNMTSVAVEPLKKTILPAVIHIEVLQVFTAFELSKTVPAAVRSKRPKRPRKRHQPKLGNFANTVFTEVTVPAVADAVSAETVSTSCIDHIQLHNRYAALADDVSVAETSAESQLDSEDDLCDTCFGPRGRDYFFAPSTDTQHCVQCSALVQVPCMPCFADIPV